MKNGAHLFPVGVDGVKSLLFGRLKHNDPGPGYLHFYPTVGPDYFQELTAERQVLRYRNGFPERVWVKKAKVRTKRWTKWSMRMPLCTGCTKNLTAGAFGISLSGVMSLISRLS